MKLLIKTLIMFVLLFIFFFPASILVDTVFTNIESAATTYGDTTYVSNHTGFFGNVFRIIYSIAGVSIALNLIILAFSSRREDLGGDIYDNL